MKNKTEERKVLEMRSSVTDTSQALRYLRRNGISGAKREGRYTIHFNKEDESKVRKIIKRNWNFEDEKLTKYSPRIRELFKHEKN